MDLKSMLNDSSAQRQPPPRLHTTQSHDHTPIPTPSYESYPDRSQAHPQPLSAAEYRSPANGSYFAVQSPRQQISPPAVTPGIAGQPAYAQSPGPHGQFQTPREGIPPSHPYQPPLAPSPSIPQPPTPGSVHHYQTPSSAATYHHPGAYAAFNAPSPREDASSSNGSVHPGSRTLSPQAQFHPPLAPATPLGPPALYPRPSPYQHRPLSQGQEGFRRLSASSVGSAQSREYNQQPRGQSEHSRNGSIPRTSGEMRERERSIESVSPKTIPKPSPRRASVSLPEETRKGSQPPAQVSSDQGSHPPAQASSDRGSHPPAQASSDRGSHPPAQASSDRGSHPPAQASSDQGSNGHFHESDGQLRESDGQPQEPPNRIDEAHQHETTPKSASTSAEPRATPQHQIYHPSPGTAVVDNTTPQSIQSIQSPFSAHTSPPATVQATLKRTASVVSSANATPQPPRKRRRRDDVPIFARSARSRPLRFIDAPPAVALARNHPLVRKDTPTYHIPNGQPQDHGIPPADTAENQNQNQNQNRWEPCITNVVPYEDLSRRVSDWIYQTIGMAEAPGAGAVFEIEAKLGSIVDEQTGHRLILPVETEALFNRDKFWGRTSFQTSMTVAQHQILNTFLNDLVHETMRDSTGRPVIGYDHPREYDEFYELTEEGRRNLAPSILTWLNPRHKPRVRSTIDESTNRLKAQIIKSRLADIDIYNPNSDFDYRISISIESPWEGERQWLTEMTGGGRDRKKDRMSYRHLGYQIDLTQVSYTNRPEKEHELEIEISTEQIRVELANLRDGRPSKYEELVRGLLDNVRTLCRTGSVKKVR
ncbi:hypothetical protein A1O3_08839 [Capronia epimyces CBS 606.96]|uniref:mRNA-capping enzyme subunit beta n=1 Tax=Capronia epimyces CBS 606.96 TaxID=1182542 RepID=W9XFT5_9EURO|nr:uncharacterized protein A1O3_08839 [Capronia epimyces CBS 606.96]EXJ79337.1 hypothetical protein A1O3_08839 [Capronia epimyces CBS 606.96]